MLRSAVSLIELLIVIAVIALLAAVSLPAYRVYQIRNDLNLAAEQLTQGLGRAKLLSQSGQGDSRWGFYVPEGILYQGESYATRNSNFDESYPMPSTIQPSGEPMDVSFSRLEGVPSATGSIILTGIDGERREILIQLSSRGVPVVMPDPITFCHKNSPGNCNTKTVPLTSWPAHQEHGDFLGPCEGREYLCY